MRVAALCLALGAGTLAGSLAGCGGTEGTPDAGGPGMDSSVIPTGPCTDDSECGSSYCNPGSHLCCQPATPPYEICGDRIDQNCDRHDESCGDNDGDGVQACMPGEDPLGGCDCDDERAAVRPPVADIAGALELCDGLDNDCNGRIDEASACCAGCDSLGSERSERADVCTESGECDCAGEPGVGVCAPGLRCCTAGCVDVNTDFNNCGVCGGGCTVSSDSCTGGECRCGTGSPCDLDTACTAGACS